jgi:hypothetical protein
MCLVWTQRALVLGAGGYFALKISQSLVAQTPDDHALVIE